MECHDASPFNTLNAMGAPALSCADLVAMSIMNCDSDAGDPQRHGNPAFAGIPVKDMCRVTCGNCNPRVGH